MKILQALADLCKEQPYETISVLEICKNAGVSRSTFYHHFFGKDDITQWHSNIMYSAGIDKIGRSLTWFEGHLITTRAFEPYKDMYRSASSLGILSGPRPAFIRHRVEVLTDTLVNYQHKELTPLLSFQIRCTAIMEAEASLSWFSGSSEFNNIKDFCHGIESLVPYELHEALKHPVEKDGAGTFFAGFIW